jgi:hypothetical protein
MNRRGFFKAIGTAVLGMSLALRLPERDENYLPSIKDHETGISIRFIRNWDAVESRVVNRLDCYFGIPEQIAGRISG